MGATEIQAGDLKYFLYACGSQTRPRILKWIKYKRAKT